MTPTVAIVGGGFTGALFGLKLSLASPRIRVVIVESGRRLGRGVAYGACTPQHLLNVPVSRMEVGLQPGFAEWLGKHTHELGDALEESGGDLAAAYVPRKLFGDYIEARVAEALTTKPGAGLASVRGEVVGLAESPKRGVRLRDGREIAADTVVLATGNLPPRAPGGADPWFYDHGRFVTDPWAVDAFDGLGRDETLLLIGTGLTMVDVALRLGDLGHKGKMLALSRRGLVPRVHAGGGSWPPFLRDAIPASPLALCKLVRSEVAKAEASGVPWQRVFDAARPAIASVWSHWNARQRKQFLSHLRPRWDIHRHRMAPRIDAALQGLIASGQLEIAGGRIRKYETSSDGVRATIGLRGGGTRVFEAARVVNCTGPDSALDRTGIPLIAEIREEGIAMPDRLGLGLETSNCAVLDAARSPSSWLYALGPLTRPSWWEITAVPEICVQVDGLVARLARPDTPGVHDNWLTPQAFLDLGEGI